MSFIKIHFSDQAQFRELEAFAKFGSDLDAVTLSVIDKGRKNVEILKQPEHAPVKVQEQAAIIFCGTKGLMKDVPIDKVREFEKEYIEFMNTSRKDIMDRLAKGEYSDEITNVLTEVAKDLTKKYKK